MVRKAQSFPCGFRFQPECSQGFVEGLQPARELITDASLETQQGNSCQFSILLPLAAGQMFSTDPSASRLSTQALERCDMPLVRM